MRIGKVSDAEEIVLTCKYVQFSPTASVLAQRKYFIEWNVLFLLYESNSEIPSSIVIVKIFQRPRPSDQDILGFLLILFSI